MIKTGDKVKLRNGSTAKVGPMLNINGTKVFEVGLAFIKEDGKACGNVEVFDVVDVIDHERPVNT